MKYNRKSIRQLSEGPISTRRCIDYTLEKVERERKEHGDFATVQEFITRMLAAGLDIHSFTVLEKYVPMTFEEHGSSAMFRPLLALMGYDPDFSDGPDVETHPESWWHTSDDKFLDDIDDDELPFM